jgi:tape measure domain-containing protein
MSDVKVKFTADSSQLQSGVKSVEGSLSGLGKSVAGVVGVMATAYGAVKGFQALGAAIWDASKSAASYETLSVSLEVLTGSAEKAAKLLGEVTKLGAETPLEMTDLAQATQTLLAFGIGAQDVAPTLKMLGDVGLGNAEKLQSLAVVFGQVSANGKLMGGDVLQMVNVGFNPLINISKKLGKSMVDTRKLMEEGGITVDMLKQAFVDATSNGGQFEGMMARIAKTTEGKLSNMSDNVDALKRAFGTGFNTGLRDALDAVNGGLPKIQQALAGTGQMIGNAITDSVSGDFAKFAAIGDLIGTVIAAAANKAFKKGMVSLGTATLKGADFLENEARDNLGITPLVGHSTLGKQSEEAEKVNAKADTRIMFNTIEQGLTKIFANPVGLVPGTNGAFRYPNEGETSSFRDANGNAVIEVLNRMNGDVTKDPLVPLQKTQNAILGDILTETKNNRTQTTWQ